MTGSGDSPVLARAPLLLSESLMFPYREGLSFEQDVWMDQGQTAAFAGALDRPPTSSWEIINPREYEKGHLPPVSRCCPTFIPSSTSSIAPMTSARSGQLDVHILTGIFGGDSAARDLTPAWDGGIYWAGQLRNATTPARAGLHKIHRSASISRLEMQSPPPQAFARLYEDELGRKYSGAQTSQSSAQTTRYQPASDEQVYHHQ